MPPKALGALLLLAQFAACADSVATPSETVDSLCGVSLVDTSDWTLHDEGMFSIKLPARFGATSHGGMDSFSGRWHTESQSVSYDWGSYSNDLTRADHLSTDEIAYCDPTPLGATRVARYVQLPGRFGPGGESVAVHWADLHAPNAHFVREHLSVFGRVEGEDSLAEVLTILASVEIRKPEDQGPWPGKMSGVVICGSDDDPPGCGSSDAGQPPNKH